MTRRIAAVLAVHNRAQQTLDCLRALAGQQGVDDVELTVHVTDDGSTDGTAERVLEEFPATRIHPGDGSLFWNGGMRRAFAAALTEDHDAYLWLNDDTLLDPDALATLLGVQRVGVVVGSTRDPQDGHLTYGGLARASDWRPLKFDLVEPGATPRLVATMNGNVVLIPRPVARRVGNLEPAYRHGLGDLDYGLRARRAGFELWMAPATIGICAWNPVRDVGERPLREEWRALRATKQLPLSDWGVFARRWAGPLWPVYWASPYVRRGAGLLLARMRPGYG